MQSKLKPETCPMNNLYSIHKDTLALSKPG